MTGDEHDGTGIIIFGVGILVGAFAAFLILKGREQQAPAVAAQQPQSMDMSAEVQSLYAELQRLRIENDELRLNLQIAAPRGPVMTAAPQAPVSTPAPAPVLKEGAAQVNNKESWDFKKDNKGKITGLEIIRKVTRT